MNEPEDEVVMERDQGKILLTFDLKG